MTTLSVNLTRARMATLQRGERRAGLLARVLASFGRLRALVERRLCALRGHDVLLSIERDRLSLRCASCGWESPGWDVRGRRPRVRFRVK